MKTQMRVFLCIVCSVFFFAYNVEGKTPGMHKDEIDWPQHGDPDVRSLSPIDGYAEDGTVVLYLYEKPEVAKVTIMTMRGA